MTLFWALISYLTGSHSMWRWTRLFFPGGSVGTPLLRVVGSRLPRQPTGNWNSSWRADSAVFWRPEHRALPSVSLPRSPAPGKEHTTGCQVPSCDRGFCTGSSKFLSPSGWDGWPELSAQAVISYTLISFRNMTLVGASYLAFLKDFSFPYFSLTSSHS